MTMTANTERTTPADPRPTGRTPGPIPTAFAELADRNDRLEHVIDNLASMIDGLAERLRPVLPETDPGPDPGTLDLAKAVGVPDSRGMVARTISSQAHRVDFAGDRITAITSRVDRLIDTLEV